MKIAMIRQENAKKVCNTCTLETFLEKIKHKPKRKFIFRLRETLPSMQGSTGRYAHIYKIPRVYPVAEFRHCADGAWKFKCYNGIVILEVNQLSGCFIGD